MCDFISWKVDSLGNVFFLTDEDVFSGFGREALKNTKDNDILGHGAIDKFYGVASIGTAQHEYKIFWEKKGYPPEIAKYLESPQTVLATWGRMLKLALQGDDDVDFILAYAPMEWREPFMDTLIQVVSREAYHAYRILGRTNIKLTNKQRDILVQSISNEVFYSYQALFFIGTELTKDQVDVLVETISGSTGYSNRAMCEIDSLTEDQKNVLRDVLKNSMY